ncbi:endonuclease/exonuclease/phosphatase [Limosilactobacillus fermentum]
MRQSQYWGGHLWSPRAFKAQNRETVPTVRSTDLAYRSGVNYLTVCDGFLVSNNVTATATNINTDFDYADHNPVKLTFILK